MVRPGGRITKKMRVRLFCSFLLWLGWGHSTCTGHGLEVLAVIPARAGSKSVPHKNIRSLAGLPLLAHSIKHALASHRVTRVLVSTDSEAYRAVALEHGAEAPFLRPAALSGDLEPDLGVFQHALSWLAEHEPGYAPHLVVHLRATCPVRVARQIDRAVSLLLSRPDADSVRSVARVPGPDPWRMWLRNEQTGDMEQLALPPGFTTGQAGNSPRQLLPPIYVQDSCIEVTRPANIVQHGSMTGTTVLGLVLPKSVDIDTEAQFLDAVEVLKHRQPSPSAAVAAQTCGAGARAAAGHEAACHGSQRNSGDDALKSRTGIVRAHMHHLLDRPAVELFLSAKTNVDEELRALASMLPLEHTCRAMATRPEMCADVHGQSLVSNANIDPERAAAVIAAMGPDNGGYSAGTNGERCGPAGFQRILRNIIGSVSVSRASATDLGSCAVVGSGGQLRGSGYGRIIDGHTSIIRFNQAPIVGFEADVGSRTSVRILSDGTYDADLATAWGEENSTLVFNGVNFHSYHFLEAMLTRTATDGEGDERDLPVLVGPVRRERLQGILPSFLAHVSEGWLNIGGADPHRRKYVGLVPSTGLTGILWALDACSSISTFGFGRQPGKPAFYFKIDKEKHPSHHLFAQDPNKETYHDWGFERDLIQDLDDEGLLTKYV